VKTPGGEKKSISFLYFVLTPRVGIAACSSISHIETSVLQYGELARYKPGGKRSCTL